MYKIKMMVYNIKKYDVGVAWYATQQTKEKRNYEEGNRWGCNTHTHTHTHK